MLLVDTSVWVDHLRSGSPELVEQLESGQVLSHPFVVGELAMGSLAARGQVLGALRELPKAVVAEEDEVLTLVDRYSLFGLGLGYVDAHLLASTRLTPGAVLWTRDRRLGDAALRLGVAH